MNTRKLPTWREMHMDTSPRVEEMQFALYRETPVWKKLQLVAELNQTARTLALSGLRRRHPSATPQELQHLLAQLLLGSQLADLRFARLEIETKNDAMANLSPVDVTLLVTDTLDRLGVPYLIEVSERQWRDVLGVLKAQAERLDLAYLRKWASQLNITDLLERALIEAVVQTE